MQPWPLLALGTALLVREAWAAEVLAKAEAGLEVDSNPHRLAMDSATAQPVPALVERASGRLSLALRPHPVYRLNVAILAAAKRYEGLGPDDASEEDVAVVSGDLRLDARLGSRPVSWGLRLSGYDALERDTLDEGRNLDHDFRTADTTASVTLFTNPGERAMATAGYRWFWYKPDSRFDFGSEHAGLAYRRSFEAEEGPTYDLAVDYAFHRRAFGGEALLNMCSSEDADCLVLAHVRRNDLLHVFGLELVHSGERILGARYELHVNTSNSFGQSLVRQRVVAYATTETLWSIFVSVRATLQLIHFLDPVLLSRDIGVLTIEDENRNSLALHATRDLGAALALEARYTFSSNEFAAEELAFRRHAFYVGAVYTFDTR